MLFGVCAGIADYFGFDVTVTRVLIIVAALFSFPLLIIAYILLAILLPRKPFSIGEGSVDPVQRQVRSDPHDTLGSVRHRFRDLDSRLQRLEKYVTSNRFKLDREFRQLKG
jgi:phage shock protein C